MHSQSKNFLIGNKLMTELNAQPCGHLFWFDKTCMTWNVDVHNNYDDVTQVDLVNKKLSRRITFHITSDSKAHSESLVRLFLFWVELSSE